MRVGANIDVAVQVVHLKIAVAAKNVRVRNAIDNLRRDGLALRHPDLRRQTDVWKDDVEVGGSGGGLDAEIAVGHPGEVADAAICADGDGVRTGTGSHTAFDLGV